jgi:predicted amidohydrolase YtcJ
MVLGHIDWGNPRFCVAGDENRTGREGNAGLNTLRATMLFGCALVLLACGQPAENQSANASPPASLVIQDARVWTGDTEMPWAEAVALDGDLILAVGSNEEIEALVGADTEIIAVAGSMLVPGFIDTHVHFLNGGKDLASVKLRDADTPEEFARRIGEFAKTVEPGEWILGGTWDHENWGGELPRRDWIDDLTPENPVWVSRLDGHMGVANSLALSAAGMDADTPDIAGGEITRYDDGRPAGVLKDNAMLPMFEAVPPPSEEQLDRQLQDAMQHMAASGVTTVHDMASWDSLATFKRAHERGALTTRIYSVMQLPDWERLRDTVASSGNGDDWLRIGGLKVMMDGSLGSHTAAFFEPFTDKPDDRGLVLFDLDELGGWVQAADAAGLHIISHAIGDRAIRDLLDIYLDVVESNGERDRRFRIEHAQHIHPDDIARFAVQDVIASMQPYHAIDDGRWAEKVIGPERIKTTYAFRSLLDADARVTFGSDWTVAPASPIAGIYAAVTRRTIDDANPDGWVPEQKITVEESLRAYTVDAAYASFEEGKKGMIRTGMLADLVLLDQDLTAIDPLSIAETRILYTLVGGKTVYKAE